MPTDRIVATLTAAAVLVAAWASSPPAAGVSGFGDVEPGRFYTQAVQWMVDTGITTGTSPTCFSPDDAVTRGQAAAFLWRMEGEPAASSHPFADIARDYQHDPVSWLYESGVTTGTSATTFSPERTLSRGELAALLWRLAGEPTGFAPHPFTDVVAIWQQTAVSWMADAGVTTGTTPTTFSPDDRVTRGQLATFLHRYQGEPPVTVLMRHPESPGCAAQIGRPATPRLLFVGDDPEGRGAQVFATAVDDGSPAAVRLTTSGDHAFPAWSPDSSLIAYELVGDGIWTMEPDGGSPQRLVADPAAGHPSWSPDGTRLVFHSSRESASEVASSCDAHGAPCPMDLFVVELATGEIRQLTFDDGDDRAPAWGPSADIAFISDRDGDPELHTVGADGSGLQQRTSTPLVEENPDWVADASAVVLTQADNDAPETPRRLARVDLATGAISGVNLFGDVDQRFPTVSPTNRLAYALGPDDPGPFLIVTAVGDEFFQWTGQRGSMPDFG